MGQTPGRTGSKKLIPGETQVTYPDDLRHRVGGVLGRAPSS